MDSPTTPRILHPHALFTASTIDIPARPWEFSLASHVKPLEMCSDLVTSLSSDFLRSSRPCGCIVTTNHSTVRRPRPNMLNHIKDHGATPMIALVSQDRPLREIDQKSDSFGLAWGISRVFPAVSPQTDLSFDDCGEAEEKQSSCGGRTASSTDRVTPHTLIDSLAGRFLHFLFPVTPTLPFYKPPRNPVSFVHNTPTFPEGIGTCTK